MVAQKTMGIILANMHDSLVTGLTDTRSMASIPFAGRYRLIDFHLSNLVHAEIRDIGIIVKENYHSLMRHIGSGRDWDLSRKIEGVQIYPPFIDSLYSSYTAGRVYAIYNVLPFIKASSSKYAVITDCDHVCNVDFSSFVNEHISSNADISILSRKPESANEQTVRKGIALVCDKDNRIVEIAYNNVVKNGKNFLLGMNIMVMERKLLIDLIEDAFNHQCTVIERDILIPKLKELFIRAHVFTGFVRRIDSIESYFHASMSLLDRNNHNALFLKERPVFTKVNDDAPTRYGLDSDIKNSLIADGCVIEGSVENSILFRGVVVEKGAVIKNSVLMQGSVVEQNATVHYCVFDKYVKITDGRSILGYETFPLYINKGSII